MLFFGWHLAPYLEHQTAAVGEAKLQAIISGLLTTVLLLTLIGNPLMEH